MTKGQEKISSTTVNTTRQNIKIGILISIFFLILNIFLGLAAINFQFPGASFRVIKGVQFLAFFLSGLA
nr:hypothetical protein [Bacteroidota bacterium]